MCGIFNSLMVGLGLAPSESDKRIMELVNNGWKSARVVGRGTIVIDPSEVAASDEFKAAREKCRLIVEEAA